MIDLSLISEAAWVEAQRRAEVVRPALRVIASRVT